MSQREITMYVLRKGKNIITATENREYALTMQFLSGGEITKEQVLWNMRSEYIYYDINV